MTVRLGIAEAAEALAATSDTPRLDAELLMAALLGVDRNTLLLRHLRDEMPSGYARLVRRRMAHEPVAYILGEAEFYGLRLAVSPAVLIPRADSETLIEAAREAFAARPAPRRILDLGTGSGALLVAALSLWPEAHGIGLEASVRAAQVARDNVAALDLADRARVVDGSWTARGWDTDLGTFDLILCNPPYVEDEALLAPDVRVWEPADALFAGPDGLDDYRILIPQLAALLNPDGVAVLEIGHTQADAVTSLASEHGFMAELRRDLAGRPRALLLR